MKDVYNASDNGQGKPVERVVLGGDWMIFSLSRLMG